MAALSSDFPKSTFPDGWEQVKHLRPKLGPKVEFYRHLYRGEYWYVLADNESANHFRCGEAAHAFLSLLDGDHDVGEAFEQVSARSVDAQLDPTEVIRVLAALRSARLLETDSSVQSGETCNERAAWSTRWRQALMRPLAMRFPLLDPDRFLTRTAPWIAPLFTRLSFGIWSFMMLWAGILTIGHWPQLSTHWDARFLDPQNLLWCWVLYPMVKGLHELGHGFACKIRGGDVREMGILLLIFTPVPYVDASSSSVFEAKSSRILVGAAGILVELFLAAAGLLVWDYQEPGLVRDVAFNIAVIGGLSTLLFNGNPLLRFDAYYVLSDWIEIPNLATRSNQYLAYLVKRFLFGFKELRSPVSAQGEASWFSIYGISAGIYRYGILAAIVLSVAEKYFIVGVFLALWTVSTQILIPAVKSISGLVAEAKRQNRVRRMTGGVAASALTVYCLLFWIPVTQSTYAEGIVALSDDAFVRAGSDGFVARIFRKNGDFVRKNDPLFQLENNSLDTRLEILRAKRAELTARYQDVLIRERYQAEIYKDEIHALDSEINEVEAQIKELRLLSPRDGLFSVPRLADLPGRFIEDGGLLGYVADFSSVHAQIVVPQDSVDLVRRDTEAIEVKLFSRSQETLMAHLVREIPLATDHLPSRILGSSGGGKIAVDARNKNGTTAMKRVFEFEIELPRKSSGDYFGQRLAVRFIHSREPLAHRFYRQFRRHILTRFEL